MRTPGVRRFRIAAGWVLLLVVVASAPTSVLAASDPLRNAQWNLDRVWAERAWQRSTGEGVLVALIGTGVHLEHEDLSGRVVPGPDLVDDDGYPADAHGHGTVVAGVVAASTGNGAGIAAMVPDAVPFAIRVLDEAGHGTADDVAAGIDAAVEEAERRAMPLVVNLGLAEVPGVPQDARGRIAEAVHWAHAAGALVVVPSGLSAPAQAEELEDAALLVGATDQEDRATLSTVRTPHVFAPGTSIVSTDYEPLRPTEHALYTCADPACEEGDASGTSLAAAHAAGLGALLLSQGVSADRARDIIIDTADALVGSAECRGEWTCGRINAAAATSAAAEPAATPRPTPAPAPAREVPPEEAEAPPAARVARATPAPPEPVREPGVPGRPVTEEVPAPLPTGETPEGAPVPLRTGIAAALVLSAAAVVAYGWRRPWQPPGGPRPLEAGHLPMLDGVRGIAILGVIAFHVFAPVRPSDPAGNPLVWPLAAGSLGVDLFFILSGFLLAQSWDAMRRRSRGPGLYGGYAWRRALRLLPVYWLMLIVLIPIKAPELLGDPGLLALFAGVQQFIPGHLPWRVNDVTWSLTTEVHFYLLLPLLFGAMRRLGPLKLVGATTLVSLAWRVALQTNARWPADLLPGYLSQFVAGMAAAMILAQGDRSALARVLRSPRAGVLMLAALAGLVFAYGSVYPLMRPDNPVWIEMVVHPFFGLLLGAMFIRIVGRKRSPILETKPLVWAGLISYSWYLWHLPILQMSGAWGGVQELGVDSVAWLGVLSIPVAAASYLLIERPPLRWKDHRRLRRSREPARPQRAAVVAKSRSG